MAKGLTVEGMAEKLGYKIEKKKTLVENDNKFYSRTDIIVHDGKKPDTPPRIFRDKASLELWLESRLQLDLLQADSGRSKRA